MIKSGDDLGRPSIDGSLVVWHKTTRKSSRLLIANVHTGHVKLLRLSRRLLLSNPSLRGGVLVWVEQDLGSLPPSRAPDQQPPHPHPPAHRHAATVLDDGRSPRAACT